MIKYEFAVIIPVNTENYNKDILKNVNKLFPSAERFILLMGKDAEHHKVNLPSNAGTVITINEEFNFARCISGSMKYISKQLQYNMLVCISNLTYAWGHTKINYVSNNKVVDFDKEFLYINVFNDLSDNRITSVDSLSLSNVLKKLRATIDNGKAKLIDQIYITRLDHMVNIIDNLSKDINNFKMKDIKDSLLRMKLIPIESNKRGYNLEMEIKNINKSVSENSKLSEIKTENKSISIINTINNNKIGITIPFPNGLTSIPRFVGYEQSWKDLLPLLNKTGIFNIYITGKYPFIKETFRKNCPNVWFLEDDMVEDSDYIKLVWAIKNSKLVFGIKNECSIEGIKLNKPTFLIGRNFESLTIPTGLKTKFIDIPNPKFDGCSIYKEIRIFLGV